MRLTPLIFLLVFSRNPLAAQITGPYTVDDGIAQGFITSVIQDADGFIWAGTYNGISRFDGIHFKNFHSREGKQSNALISNKISYILNDNNGKLWVMNGKCFQVYDTQNGHFLTPDYFQTNQINDITDACFDIQNRLWVLGQKTLYCFRLTGAGIVPQIEPVLTIPLSHPELSGTVVMHFENDIAWIGTKNGLWNYNVQTGMLSKNTLIKCRVVNQIWGDKNYGGIWVQSDSGSGVLNGRQVQWFPEVKSTTGMKFRGAFFNKQTYLVADNALWKWDGKQLSREQELSFSAISGFQDNQGNIWLGSNASGLFKLEVAEKHIQSFWNKTFVSEPIGADWRGNVFSLPEKGCTNLQVAGKMPFILPKMKKTAVDNHGTFWYLDCENQLCDEKGNCHKINSLKPGAIVNFMSVSERNVVLVTAKQICWKNTLTGKEIVLDALLPEQAKTNGTLQVNCLQKDQDGKIWIGMNNGLLAAEADWNEMEAFAKFYECGKELPASEILSVEITRTPNVALWLGTMNGFYRFELSKGLSTPVVTPDITAQEVVYCLQHDMEGKLWLGTNAGLKMYDPAAGASSWFDVSDGLPANEFNRNTGFLSADGEIMMGTVKGAVRFYPSNLTHASKDAKMVFSELILNNSIMYMDARGGVLNCNDGDMLTVRFSLLDFWGAHHRNYKFRILGVSPDWQTTQNASVNLAALRPGTYTLEVMGAMGKSQWSKPARVKIVVRMAWQSKLAVFMPLLVTLLIAAYWLYRFWLSRQTKQLQARVTQETDGLPDAARDIPAYTIHDKVADLIERHFKDSEFNVVDIQTKLKISRAHLHRKMLDETGKTTAYFLKKRRIDEAEFLLLQHPDMTVAQVAYASGFNDPNYFSTVFSSNFGMSPKKFRENKGAKPE